MVISAIAISRSRQSSNRLRGYASVTIDNMFVIHDIKIIESQEGLFIGMPSKEVKGGTFRDIAHPINRDARSVFENLILEAYKEAVASDRTRIDWVLKEEAKDAAFLDLTREHYKVRDIFAYESSLCI